MSYRTDSTNALLLSAAIAVGVAACVESRANDLTTQEAAISFSETIGPILSDKCYFCHGPDADRREADLRLDTAAGSKEAIESGEVSLRINSDDEFEVMPPPESKISLSEEEKKLLQRWLDSGAPYEKHWGFRPLPKSVETPTAKPDSATQNGDAWPKQPLDTFVLRRLEQEGLSASDEATPERWLRRAKLDLTGLPTTLGEVETFLDELKTSVDTEAVYAEAVDRMLASPAYGEHFAVAWLGAARYADSYGYQSDKLNTQWPYRDWVVRVLNQNLPYNDFLTWQLAGDLLDQPGGNGPTREQLLATAFNRLHRLNNEGGAVFEEWRLENVADRVHTFGTAVLGLTMECCRCHDHKYDPISTREYYSLSAFFNSIDESGVYDRTSKVPSPSMLLPTEEQTQALNAAGRQVADAVAEYRKTSDASKPAFAAWSKTPESESIQPPEPLVSLAFDKPYDKKMKPVYYPSASDRNQAAPGELVACDESPLPWVQEDAADKHLKAEPSGVRSALKLDGERGVTVPGIPRFDRWAPFSVVISLRETERQPLPSVIAHHSQGTDCGYNGWDMRLVDGRLETRLYRHWPGNGIGIRTIEKIPADQWLQVSMTYDGSSRAAGLMLFLNGEPLEVEVLRDRMMKSANVDVDHGGVFVVGQRFRDRGLAGGLIDDVRVYDRSLTFAELNHLATGAPIKPTADFFQAVVHKPSIEAFRRLTEAREAFVMAEEVMQEIPIMEETAEPRETHILARGVYDAPTSDETRVDRTTFAEIGPAFPEDAPRDRLGLSQWVTHPDHPLTARVMVNRIWANFFGSGLVRTPDNFGRQGEAPTHPQLLDWLARDFVENGWDMKRLCRDIVLSATYRQQSRLREDLADVDPENLLLARGPAHRLSAEQLRDVALASSGLLNRQMGGPPVSPYQPGGDLWRESNTMSPAYKQSVGVDLHRRSLYSVWKRTAPLPNMLAFDAETREVCTVSRSRTNTPLQALVLLNDTQFVEAARSLAEEVLLEHDDPAEAINLAYRRFTGRRPTDRERQLLVSLHAEELEHYTADPAAAKSLLAVGERSRSTALEAPDAAAMTMVCRVILNLDATVWKR